MKRYRYGLVVLLVALVVAGCAPAAAPAPAPAAPAAPAPAPKVAPEDAAWAQVVAAARKEGLVTIYSVSNFAGDSGRGTVETFSNEYGIRVELLLMAARHVVERIKIENTMKRPIADIMASGLTSATELSLAGLLDSIWQELPELRNKAVFKVDPVYSPNGDLLTMSIALTGALINTKLVKAQDEPRSYVDLLDAKWKGQKIIFPDPSGVGGGGSNFYPQMRYYKILDDDYFRRLARQEPFLFGGSSQEQYNMVARGEVWLNPEASTVTVADLILQGAPLKLLGMKEGSGVQPASIAMVKGATHPNATKLFINWILSRKGQEFYAREKSIDSMRKDVPDFTDPRVRLQPEPGRLLARTWEYAEAANQYRKEGTLVSIFGKK